MEKAPPGKIFRQQVSENQAIRSLNCTVGHIETGFWNGAKSLRTDPSLALRSNSKLLSGLDDPRIPVALALGSVKVNCLTKAGYI